MVSILAAVAFYHQTLAPIFKAEPILKMPSAKKTALSVNGIKVTAGEIQELLWDWRREEVIQDVVAYLLISQEAEKQGIKLTDAQVKQKVMERIQQTGATQAALASQGYPSNRIYLRVKVELLVDALARKELNLAEYMHLKVLIISPTGREPAAKADAQKRADDAYAKLKANGKWDEVYSLYGAKDALFQSKGDLNWRQTAEFEKVVGDQIKGLKVGEISKPIPFKDTLQIYQLVAKGDSLKGKEKMDLENQVLPTKIGAIAARLKAAGKVERFDN